MSSGKRITTKVPGLRALRKAVGMSQDDLASALGYSTRQIARWENGEGQVREAIIRYLEHLQPTPPAAEACDFTFAELFAGIGGFRMGFEAAGGRSVFAAERDAYARTTYSSNFGREGLHGDIRKVKAENIPDHDILLAPFPCESFGELSARRTHVARGKRVVRGKSAPVSETHGTSFFEIERVLRAKRPKAFVLETSVNLMEHDDGKTFAVIQRVLEKSLGYRISVKTLDATHWLPLHRERAYIVGTRRDAKSAFNWKAVEIPDINFRPHLVSVMHHGAPVIDFEARFTNRLGLPLPKYRLSASLWKYLKGEFAKRGGEDCGPQYFSDVARTFSPRYYKDGSEILLREGAGNPRRLTPRECSRLMGFDGDGSTPFKIVVSDTQAYKQFGGASAVPVVEAIAFALAPRVVGVKAGSKGVRGGGRQYRGAKFWSARI